MSLKDFFRESDRITNVKIVCRDGLVFTHKIIVASVNNFFKDIISINPDGDEVVLIMPAHEKKKIDKMIKLDWFKGMDGNESFGEISQVKLENDLAESYVPDTQEVNNLHESLGGTNVAHKEEFKMTKNVEHDDKNVIKRVQKEGFNAFDYENYFDKEEKEEYKESIMKLLEELEKKTVSAPCNPEEEKMFNLLQRQISHERAKLDLLTGNIKTVAEACRVHGVISQRTLKRLFMEKKRYDGHSASAQNVFTTLEEQTIIDEYVQRNNGMKVYKLELLNNVILDKMKEIHLTHPERDFSKAKQLAWKIAKRFGLTIQRPEAKFECEICSKPYSMKNTLNKHLKDVHFL